MRLLRRVGGRAKIRWLRVLGRRTRVLDAGSGPVVICSAGVGSAIPDWLPLVEELAADHRVIVFARPGWREASPQEAECALAGAEAVHEAAGAALTRVSLPVEAARLVGVLDACGVREPALALGHSMGAYIVEAALRLHPERLRGGVFLDGSTLSEAGLPFVAGRPAPKDSLVRTVQRRLLARARFLFDTGSILVGALRWAGIYARHGVLPLAYVQPGFLRRLVREIVDFEHCAGQLAALRSGAPLRPQAVLGIFPASGLVTQLRSRRWVGEVFAEARELARECRVITEVITRSGHFVMADRPALSANLIRRVEAEFDGGAVCAAAGSSARGEVPCGAEVRGPGVPGPGAGESGARGAGPSGPRAGVPSVAAPGAVGAPSVVGASGARALSPRGPGVGISVPGPALHPHKLVKS
ncbi:alpha/beta fold hydrolase [Brevibacterium sp. 5221]|uniref:Alpha/beta fold hydrolase n=1 Tax=Brevibacterium rongguiense TaxID=2695267 RepID=A0A6N9H7W2_9MICO|nr:alpha/beta hydrolase [Brevibacterium rongguiense]MYM19886.1 alpha/beta fold hydrolase [Brevibacterium rongguiense]